MTLDLVISIICTDNARALQGCLDSLPSACDGLKWEAFVIDNASTDHTAEVVRGRYPWARLIVNGVRQGFSANHNQVLLPAVREDRARYVLILNDDVILDRHALTTLVAAADAEPEAGALGPAIRGIDGTPQQSLFPFPTLLPEAGTALGVRRTPAEGPGWLNGSCVLFRTKALREVGALDETFFLFYEDTDIGLRLCQSGWRVGIAREATIVHLEHQTVSQPAPGSPMAKQMHRSQYLYFVKHKGRAQAGLLSGLTRAVLAARAAKALLWCALTRDVSERDTARLLFDLLLYSPRRPLLHELRARNTSGSGGPALAATS